LVPCFWKHIHVFANAATFCKRSYFFGKRSTLLEAQLFFFDVDAGDGHGGDAFASADEADAFVGGGFEAYFVGVDLQAFRDAEFHFLGMRIDLGFFGNDGDVNVGDGSLMQLDVASGFFEEEGAGCVFPPGIGVRKKLTDVGFAQGSEDGVTERVQDNVRIGVAIESFVVWDFDSPKDQFAALGKAVHIISNSNA